MLLTYRLSRWASRHVPFAIGLIVLIEVINAVNGLTLGATLLADVNAAGLHGATALLVGLAVGVRWWYRVGPGGYAFRRWCLFGAFLSNFLLCGLFGGLLGGSLVPRSPAPGAPTGAWGYRRVEIRSDTLVRTDVVRPAESSTAVRKSVRANAHTGKKVLFVALFVLSLFLTYFTLALACNIACSGYGFLAIVVFLLGLGFPAGGIYFLGRATDNPFKTRQEMTSAERRRTGRRFWLSWALLAGLVGLIFLISAIAG